MRGNPSAICALFAQMCIAPEAVNVQDRLHMCDWLGGISPRVAALEIDLEGPAVELY